MRDRIIKMNKRLYVPRIFHFREKRTELSYILLSPTFSYILFCFVSIVKLKEKNTVTHFLTTDYRTVRFYCLLMFKGSIRCNIFKVLGLYPLYCPSIKDKHRVWSVSPNALRHGEHSGSCFQMSS